MDRVVQRGSYLLPCPDIKMILMIFGISLGIIIKLYPVLVSKIEGPCGNARSQRGKQNGQLFGKQDKWGNCFSLFNE